MVTIFTNIFILHYFYFSFFPKGAHQLNNCPMIHRLCTSRGRGYFFIYYITLFSTFMVLFQFNNFGSQYQTAAYGIKQLGNEFGL